MEKTLKKLLLRNIFYNIKQFLSIIVIVFLSMTLYSGFLVNSATLGGAVENYFEDTNLADLWVYTNKITAEDETYLIENNIDYDKRFQISTNAEIENKITQSIADIYVYDKGKISTPYIFNKTVGCWIDQKVAKNNNIKIGQDYLKFNYQLESELGTLNLEFRFLITGTMALSEQADVYSSWPVFIDKTVFLTELNNALNSENLGAMAGIIPNFSEIPYNQILIKSNNAGELKTQLENYYNQKENSNLYMILTQDMVESVVMLRSEVSQSKKMIYIFPTVFLVVAILVMITSISQLILQEKMRIGTLKSLGARNGQLLRHYSGYGIILSLIGSLLGLIVGPLVIPEVMFVKYDLVYSLPKDYVKMVFPWNTLAVLLLLFVVLGCLTALLTCYKVVMKKPAECLKSDIKLNLKSKKHKNKLPLSLKMTFRNLAINPIRTIMAVLGCAGCVALMLCGYGIGDTLEHSIENDLEKVFSYDISSTYENNDFLTDLEQINGVDYYEKYETSFIEIYGESQSKNVKVFKIENNSQIVNFGLNNGEIAISKSIADELDITDKFKIINGENIQEIAVTKVVATAFFNGIYVCGDIDFCITSSKGVWIKSSGNIDAVVNQLNLINGTNPAESMGEVREYVENKISSISVMTTTLKIFALLLAIVVLLNLTFLILNERVKQIATLKVLGKSLWMVMLSVGLEIVFISLICMIVGMIFGFPLLVLVLSVNKVEVMNFLYFISPLSFIFTFLITLLTVALIGIILFLKVRHINMTMALKSVE